VSCFLVFVTNKPPDDLRMYDRPSSGEDDAAQFLIHGLPFEISIGYQVRATHRLLQRYLQTLIEPHGVTLGMWYFLRVLWREDGLTQRELSRRVGTMEPTALTAIVAMEREGFVKRVRSKIDRRRQHVHLTAKGRSLKASLEPLAIKVVRDASANLSMREIAILLDLLKVVQDNITGHIQDAAEADDA
jgi:DNA-binding MarR family transcriptional regulator